LINVNALIAVVMLLAAAMTSVLIILITSLSKSQKKAEQTLAISQVTGREGNPMSFDGSSDFSDTDLALSMETTGNPVLITFHANATLSTNSGINMRPTIDDRPPDNMTVQHFAGEAASRSLSFLRAYDLPQGTHKFRVQCSSQGSVSVGQRWMIVQELN